MRTAMKELGYVDTYHMMNCSIENPPDALMWMDALTAKYDGIGAPFTRSDWDQLLGNCQAVCDWPAVAFAKELIEAYPEAKVILTNRDVDSWHASTMRTVFWRVSDPELKYLHHFSWAAGMYYPMLKKFFDTFFRGDFEHQGKEVFINHYNEVRSLVPKENLLEFRVQDGWGPLCEFLGQSIPTGSKFPNTNDNRDFVSRSRRRNRMQMLNVGVRFLEIAVLIAICAFLVSVLWRL
ncbi:NAD dependent epimerase [Rhexocercosporidium sp. MPI-PUGE-AT-0058]|nr:NAD dependent epimerase [Rhexocercosporidium sp. MPI-PUGE-AT-0058]